MRRRDFIATIGGGVAMPFVATAQQTARIPRLVFLHGRAEDDLEEQARIVAFRQGLEALGWTANRNIRIEHQFSAGELARIQCPLSKAGMKRSTTTPLPPRSPTQFQTAV